MVGRASAWWVASGVGRRRPAGVSAACLLSFLTCCSLLTLPSSHASAKHQGHQSPRQQARQPCRGSQRSLWRACWLPWRREAPGTALLLVRGFLGRSKQPPPPALLLGQLPRADACLPTRQQTAAFCSWPAKMAAQPMERPPSAAAPAALMVAPPQMGTLLLLHCLSRPSRLCLPRPSRSQPPCLLASSSRSTSRVWDRSLAPPLLVRRGVALHGVFACLCLPAFLPAAHTTRCPCIASPPAYPHLAGVGDGIADAAGSFAQGTVAVAGAAGNAVADALDTVAGIFRGRRLAALLPTTLAALNGRGAIVHNSGPTSSLARRLVQAAPPAVTADGERPPSLGSCTLPDLGVSPAAAAAMTPGQQAALQAVCRALLRLTPAQEVELAASIQAAAEPYLEELAQVALPLPLALIGDAFGPEGRRYWQAFSRHPWTLLANKVDEQVNDKLAPHPMPCPPP